MHDLPENLSNQEQKKIDQKSFYLVLYFTSTCTICATGMELKVQGKVCDRLIQTWCGRDLLELGAGLLNQS